MDLFLVLCVHGELQFLEAPTLVHSRDSKNWVFMYKSDIFSTEQYEFFIPVVKCAFY